MPDEQRDDTTSVKPHSSAKPQLPSSSEAEQWNKVNQDADGAPQQHQGSPGELSREIHWLEHAMFWAQVILALIGVVGLWVYHRQLTVMQGQLQQMAGSSQQTDRLLALYRRQVEQATKQASDTHDLALAARDEATASQGIAKQAATQAVQITSLATATQREADQTRIVAENAGKQADASRIIAERTTAQAEATNRLAAASDRSAVEAEQQVAMLQRQIETSQRAWISILQPTVNRVFKAQDGEMIFGFNIPYKNIGNIPATNIKIFTILHTLDARTPAYRNAPELEKHLCNQAKAMEASHPFGVSRVAIPNEVGNYDQNLTEALPEKLSSGAEVYPLVLGCIVYRFISSPTIHETGFIYQIAHPKGVSIRAGEEVSLDTLVADDFYNGEAESN